MPRLLLIIAGIGVVVGSLLTACQTISEPPPVSLPPESASCPVPSGPIALPQPEANVTTALNKPLIDTIVHAQTEIATFALG